MPSVHSGGGALRPLGVAVPQGLVSAPRISEDHMVSPLEDRCSPASTPPPSPNVIMPSFPSLPPGALCIQLYARPGGPDRAARRRAQWRAHHVRRVRNTPQEIRFPQVWHQSEGVCEGLSVLHCRALHSAEAHALSSRSHMPDSPVPTAKSGMPPKSDCTDRHDGPPNYPPPPSFILSPLPAASLARPWRR